MKRRSVSGKTALNSALILLWAVVMITTSDGCVYTVPLRHEKQQPKSPRERARFHMPQKPAFPLPYLSKVAEQDSITIWVVDGIFVRDSIDEEFSNYGQHGAFAFIPERELWLDREAVPDESEFFIHHLLLERTMMNGGLAYDSALVAADQAELIERRDSGDLAKVMGANGLPDPHKVHEKLWKKLESGLSVWMVNGRLVRSAFDIDYTEGGHDHVYEFVPQDEVWIDNDVTSVERPYVLFHELHERNLMTAGWPYSKAHEDASRLELHYRAHPNELHLALSAEGWE